MNQSTYTRPVPPYSLLQAASHSQQGNASSLSQPLKKDKPLYKISIPNTSWLRVKTTLGNVFFTHSDRNGERLDCSRRNQRRRYDNGLVHSRGRSCTGQGREGSSEEVARIAAEVELEKLKRKATDEDLGDSQAKPRKRRKRPEATSTADQILEEITIAAPEALSPEDLEDDDGSGDDSDGENAFSNSEAEEEWQREMAEDMAKLAASEAASTDQAKESDEAPSVGPPPTKPPEETPFTVPAQVNLSIEEAKTLFKVSIK
ncbi:hypothetical protein BS47DRAFT_277021 [Hydnum rufescens UP504]|uniref:Uncharacterized protein n=1 Tax=Hydnum rufescens UP504 TaxID=1448309 RepID=A0A9P6AL21_9AGAM|nr:hypothetical protein BS47DRAFT_277021 [Hydnum rufescens UP504]